MHSDVYGFAAFQPGMEEIQDTVVPSPTAAPVSAETAVPVTVTPVTETPVDNENAAANATENEGLSLTQKALFLAVIGGVVAVYIRMNTRSASKGPAYSRV